MLSDLTSFAHNESSCVSIDPNDSFGDKIFSSLVNGGLSIKKIAKVTGLCNSTAVSAIDGLFDDGVVVCSVPWVSGSPIPSDAVFSLKK